MCVVSINHGRQFLRRKRRMVYLLNCPHIPGRYSQWQLQTITWRAEIGFTVRPRDIQNLGKLILPIPKYRTCLSEDAYLSRLDALHRTDRRRGKVEFHVCGVKFRKGSLAFHLATQHGVYHSHLLAGADTCQPVGESRTFWARHLPAKGV